MNDKKFLYKVSWKQEYEHWEQMLELTDMLMDILIEETQYADAKEVIERVKNL